MRVVRQSRCRRRAASARGAESRSAPGGARVPPPGRSRNVILVDKRRSGAPRSGSAEERAGRSLRRCSGALRVTDERVKYSERRPVFPILTMPRGRYLRAVRKALDPSAGVSELNAGLRAELGVELALRINVTLVGLIARLSSVESPTLVTGDAVNVAARLQQAAPASAILLGRCDLPAQWRLGLRARSRDADPRAGQERSTFSLARDGSHRRRHSVVWRCHPVSSGARRSSRRSRQGSIASRRTGHTRSSCSFERGEAGVNASRGWSPS